MGDFLNRCIAVCRANNLFHASLTFVAYSCTVAAVRLGVLVDYLSTNSLTKVLLACFRVVYSSIPSVGTNPNAIHPIISMNYIHIVYKGKYITLIVIRW